MNKIVKIDPWVKKILVDPLSKDKITHKEEDKILVSKYGRRYPIINGIFDLRLLTSCTNEESKKWKKGQEEYEKWSQKCSEEDNRQSYIEELEGVKEVYENIPVKGRCLDVGGSAGRLRAFLSPDQEYISCDPSINVFDNIKERDNLLYVYPFLLDPVNFICCYAEHLPFISNSFDIVHMRSVIDHFRDPELALREAYRVLRDNGELIIGSSVLGGKSGKIQTINKNRNIVKI